MEAPSKKIQARFFISKSGNNPVRDWIMDLSEKDKKTVGAAIQKVEFGWPIGMPYCRPLGDSLREVRANISDGRIARIIFFILNDEMILLHGFVKKTQTTPKQDLDLAKDRKKEVLDNE